MRGKVSRSTADGKSTMSFDALSLSMERRIRSFMLPAQTEAGQPFWEPGDMPHSAPIDLVYEGDSTLAALLKTKVAGSNAVGSGNLEMWAEPSATRYRINIVEQIGQGLAPLRLRPRTNLLSLGFTERADDMATRVYATGAPYQDQKPTLGLARWEVALQTDLGDGTYDLVLQDPAGGEGPIRFDGQFIPPDLPFDDPDTDDTVEERPNFHLQWLTGSDLIAPIIATFAATQTVRIQSTVTPTVVGLQSVRIVADGTGRENLCVDHPEMVAAYGIRPGDLPRPDIPATDNFVPNAVGRVWPDSSPLPTGWGITADFPGDGPFITRETNSRFWQHGGHAVRAVFPFGGDSRYVSLPLATIPRRAQGYLSFFVRLTTIRGRIMVWLRLRRNVLDLDGNLAPSLPYTVGGARSNIASRRTRVASPTPRPLHQSSTSYSPSSPTSRSTRPRIWGSSRRGI